MSDETRPDDASSENEATGEDRISVDLRYGGTSDIAATDSGVRLSLLGNLNRDPVRFVGRVKEPLRLREALRTVATIVGSDDRYVPKDRTKYLAYQQMKRGTASASAWEAQAAYFDWLSRNDPLAWLILDPVVTVHPDRVLFEVFSKDEGCYATLGIERELFEQSGDVSNGTTNIDFSETFRGGLWELRSEREVQLSVGQNAVGMQVEEATEVVEKSVPVPETWIRGFLQVQSATTLPHEVVTLAPVDLYNILRVLRLRADVKGKRRGLRLELMPGERPRVTLEPWDEVIETHGDVYAGQSARVIRLWGRRRLMMLRDLLPTVTSIDIHVLGSGLPSFWVLRMPGMSFTLGLTGFTASNWSQQVNFDLLLPRKTDTSQALEQVVKVLADCWFADLSTLRKETDLPGPQLLEALQLGCQRGQLMYDLANGVYRLRPLTAEPLPLDRLEYRNDRERSAHDLLDRRGAVKITRENRIVGIGVELTGKVEVTEDRRDYAPRILVTEEGNVSRTECTCPLYRKQGLKHGPCTHLIALRLAWSARQRQARPRHTILTETRTYSRRDERGEETWQVTLDRDRVLLRWGRTETELRRQTLHFNSVDAARDDYLARLGQLARDGFMDATLGG